MSMHPVFLAVNKKLMDAAAALRYMIEINAQQTSLKDSHPKLYSQAVHTAALVINLQGLYTQSESILKTLASAVDGYVPSGESWNVSLLEQCAATEGDRPAMLSASTFGDLMEMLRFRHAARSNYAGELRPRYVIENYDLAVRVLPELFGEISRFASTFGNSQAPASSQTES